MENCNICKKSISEEEYINNGGYCEQCMDKVEAIETKMGQNNNIFYDAFNDFVNNNSSIHNLLYSSVSNSTY